MKKESQLGKTIYDLRYFIIAAVVLATAVFVYGVVKELKVNVLLDEMVPPNHPFVKLHKEYNEQYGGTSTVMVALVVDKGDIFNGPTLEKIKRISDEIRFYKDVRRSFVFSISQRKSKITKGHAGGLVDVNALMWPEVDATPRGIKQLKENIYTSDFYDGVLVSKDGKASLIMADCWPDIDYRKFFDFMQGLREREEDENTTLHIAGRPMLLGWIYHFLPQSYTVFFLTAIFVLISLIYIFKNSVGIVIPLLVGGISTIWGFGFIALLGVNFNPLMLVLPVLVAARALSHSVQTTRRFLEELCRHGDKRKAAELTIDGLLLATLAAVITDAAGFMVLILARIVMIQRIAFLCSFWMVSIFILVGILGPILCVYLPTPKNIGRYAVVKEKYTSKGKTYIDRFAELIYGKASYAIAGLVILIGFVSAYFSMGMKIGDVYPGSPILWQDFRYNTDCAMINEKFDYSGTDLISVVVAGKEDCVLRPEVMKRMELYERYMTHKFPEVVAGTQSLVKITRTLHKELREGDPKYQDLPTDFRLIGNLNFFYYTSGDPSDFSVMCAGRFQHAVIRVFLKDHRGDTLRNVVSATREFFEGQPPIEGVEFKYVMGYGGILAAVNEEVEWSQTGTIVLVFLAVFVICSLSFRSFVAGILHGIPLIIAALIAFAFMALTDIGLDINTLPVSAIGVGIGVDYGIYLLSRFAEEYSETGDWETTVHVGLMTSGRGIIYTAITLTFPVILWYFLSDLKFQAEMGLLLAILLVFNMLGALLFLPAAVNILKPKFIKKHHMD